MFLMVCLGLGFFIFSAQKEMSSVPDTAGNGVAREAAVISGAELEVTLSQSWANLESESLGVSSFI
jgi:hypothetical protein